MEKIIPIYKVNGQTKSNTHNAVALCLSDHSEKFMHSFMLVEIASILCRSTQNSLDFEYLNFLMSPTTIQEFDWANHILKQILSSVRKYKSYIQSLKDDFHAGGHYFPGCLPLLAVSSIHIASFLFPFY